MYDVDYCLIIIKELYQFLRNKNKALSIDEKIIERYMPELWYNEVPEKYMDYDFFLDKCAYIYETIKYDSPNAVIFLYASYLVFKVKNYFPTLTLKDIVKPCYFDSKL
jgi:hypothetical protein